MRRNTQQKYVTVDKHAELCDFYEQLVIGYENCDIERYFIKEF